MSNATGESSVSYIAMIYRERSAAAAASTLPALTPDERHAVQYYAKEVMRAPDQRRERTVLLHPLPRPKLARHVRRLRHVQE